MRSNRGRQDVPQQIVAAETSEASNPFETLPDEVMLHMLGFLKGSLVRTGQVNKRFNRLIQDNALWTDEIITEELANKSGMTAKQLYQYRSLFALNGNYSELMCDHQSLTAVANKLMQRKGIDFNITVISFNCTVGWPKGPQPYLRATPKLFARFGFARETENTDLNQPKLVTENISEYITACLTPYGHSNYDHAREHKNAVKCIQNNPALVIFSNDRIELTQILDIIEELRKETVLSVPPLIFVMTNNVDIVQKKFSFSVPIVDIIQQSNSTSVSASLAYTQILKKLQQIDQFSYANRQENSQTSLMSYLPSFRF